MSRTNDCDRAIRIGRFSKAQQFMAAADLVANFAEDGLADVEAAYATLLVHAGIAASDVICCARLGRYSTGENHHEAINLLKQIDSKLSADLGILLRMKTKAGYSAQSINGEALRKAGRAAERLMAAAVQVGQTP